ncbi:MAG: PAS domain S-box protein [Pirellulales bacterium]|nr:PAS domain S-box protein [Pirellulales bacterium]
MSDFIYDAKHSDPHGGARKRLYASTIGVAIAGAVVSAALFFALRSEERDQAFWEFERSSRDHVSALWKTLELDFMVMRSVQSLYTGSEKIEQDEFAAFVSPLMEDHPSIRSMQWAPCVRPPQGEERFPIEWVEPRGADVAALGFNLDSDPSCLIAMRRSRETGRITMTEKTLLPYELGNQAGVRVFLPVYKQNVPLNTAEKRRDNLLGFVVGVLRLKGIAEESLASLTPVGIDVSLIDDSADADQRLLYFYSSRTRILDTAKSNGENAAPRNEDFSFSVNKEVAGRQWTVVCTASPRFFADRTTFYPWIAAAGVLMLTGLLAGYLLRKGRMAAKLAENERKLRGILEQTFQFIGLLSPDGILLDANKTALDFAGVRKESVLNKPFWDTPWWNHSPQLQEQLRRAVKRAAAGFTVRFEGVHLMPDGARRWIDASLKPLKDDDGKVVYIIPEGYDITDYKLAVQRQERSIERLMQINRLQEELMTPSGVEEKHRKITDAAVHMLDLDFCRIWLIQPADFCKYGCVHANTDEGRNVCAKTKKCLHLISSSGRYTHVEGEHSRIPLGNCKIGRIAGGPNKKYLTNNVADDPLVQDKEWARELGLVSFAGYKLRDTDGNPMGVFAAFAKHPISEEEDAFMSNLAEIASKAVLDCRAAEALRLSERHHKLFPENVTDMICALDFSGRFIYASPSVRKLFGFTTEEYLNLTLPEVMTPASFAVANNEMQEFIAVARKGERPEPGSLELELYRNDGSTVWCEISYSGMYDESGRIIAVQGICRDITARRKMEEELRRSKEAAETATQAKSQFLARVSHEIRNPMTSILGYTDLLMNPAVDPSSRNNYLAVIRRNGEHLLDLINDILDLSKIEAGKLSLDVRPCSLVSLLADVASVVRPRAENRGLSLSVEYESEIPETILTDPVRLRQALINLAGNAVKFTREGSVRIAASLLPVWQGRPAVRIQVIDTGIGIAEDAMPKLFEPFSQSDQSIFRQFGGTGLGLAISRHIVGLLGGELAATSVLGKGSNFNLTVPTGDLKGVAMLKHPAEAECDSYGTSAAQQAKELEGLRILLAEDGFDNRQLIQTVLRAAGAIVETVVNGREAVEKAETEPFDAILMDMNMPLMDGYEATRTLRGRGYEKPILALTANAMTGDEKQCLTAGCDRHLTKPIDRALLINTIAVCTGRTTDEMEENRELQMTAEHEEGPLVSLYADDPDVAGILGGFVEGLDIQLSDMDRAYSEERFDDLKRFAHRLKGAGGSYGYPTLTDASKKLENAAAAKDRPAVEKSLEDVAALCRAIKEGYQSITISAGSDKQ